MNAPPKFSTQGREVLMYVEDVGDVVIATCTMDMFATLIAQLINTGLERMAATGTDHTAGTDAAPDGRAR